MFGPSLGDSPLSVHVSLLRAGRSPEVV